MNIYTRENQERLEDMLEQIGDLETDQWEETKVNSGKKKRIFKSKKMLRDLCDIRDLHNRVPYKEE